VICFLKKTHFLAWEKKLKFTALIGNLNKNNIGKRMLSLTSKLLSLSLVFNQVQKMNYIFAQV